MAVVFQEKEGRQGSGGGIEVGAGRPGRGATGAMRRDGRGYPFYCKKQTLINQSFGKIPSFVDDVANQSEVFSAATVFEANRFGIR